MATERFQGLCLVGEEGHLYMPKFDVFPPAVRRRLRASPFNICSMCVLQQAGEGASVQQFFVVIENFERAIRAGQVDPNVRTSRRRPR